MTVLQDYKCPSCGGKVEFDSHLQKMKCPFCGSVYEVEQFETPETFSDAQYNLEDNINWNTAAGGQWDSGETDDMLVYSCNSCGGEIVAEKETGATSCPYCGNPVVVNGQFAGDLKPDLIIPFKLDKKQAKEALNNHLKGKKLLPKIFKDQNHIDEIKGLYVPFWLFDADINARVKYRATNTRSWTSGDYRYNEVSTYNIFRAGNMSYSHVPVDGSIKINDDLMESIEPYDLSEAVDFKKAYLSGYLADKYTVNAEDSIDRANYRIKNSTIDAFSSSVRGYDSVQTVNSNISLNNGTAKYALYPVWFLNTTWQNNHYYFAMNGQTGKFVGNLPMDKSLYWKHFIQCFVVSTLIIIILSVAAYFLL